MLKMTQAQEQDRGLYSCLATNEAGEAQRNFSVEVLGRMHLYVLRTGSLLLLLGHFWGRQGLGRALILLLVFVWGGTGEVAQSLKCLLCRCEDLCLVPDPKYKENNLGVVSLTQNPNLFLSGWSLGSET